MKLVTVQTLSAYNSLLKNGYLITDSKYINTDKYGVPYNFITSKMKHIENPYNAEYPLWAWVKYGKINSPRKNKLLGFFAKDEDFIVKITFKKRDVDVLVNDYIKYHFLLTNEYLPKDFKDQQKFNDLMKNKKVSKQDLLAYVRRDKFDKYRTDKNFEYINKKIQKSYDRIFCNLGQYRQGTVWCIEKEDIVNIEFIHKKD